jgi:hypothetical protein
MRTLTTLRATVLAIVTAQGLAGCGREVGPVGMLAPDPGGTVAITASSKLVTLPFDDSDFANPKDNRFFPLEPGTIWTYRGVAKDGEERNVVEVTHQTKEILGVRTTVVHDVVYLEDGSVLEETFDWYAPDRFGNVWYFGEDTKEYDHGVLVTTAGSWEAGKDGARPGIIMLAEPQVGALYKQEDAPGIVEDMGKVVSVTETVTVPTDTYTGCVKTTEWTPIEPGNRSHKFYAPGVGLVLEVASRQGGARVELIEVQ